MSRIQFWTILLGTETTSFRANDRETLLPTLKQLQRRNPEAVIKWFERGQLFDSPAAALAEKERLLEEKRPKAWRPGGDHRDPRAKYALTRDEKRRRFKERQRRPPRAATPRAGGPPRDGGRAGGRKPSGRK